VSRVTRVQSLLALLLTSLTSIPLLTDQVVWKHSSMRCSKALGSRWTLMKSFRSLVRVWYSERREYILWMMAVTFPNTTACISAGDRDRGECQELRVLGLKNDGLLYLLCGFCKVSVLFLIRVHLFAWFTRPVCSVLIVATSVSSVPVSSVHPPPVHILRLPPYLSQHFGFLPLVLQ